MADTDIEWTDTTWNPVTGCTRASDGCDNCYAVRMTKRLAAMGQDAYIGLVNERKGHFNGVVKCHENKLLVPLRWKTPRRVFVNSMSDLFHKDVPFEFINKVFNVMALCPHLTFQILTKRPERMLEYVYDPRPIKGYTDDNLGHPEARDMATLEWPPPNVWLGTSVENQATADERIPPLLRCPAAVRFLSCEPLIGPIDLTIVDTLPYDKATYGESLRKHLGLESMDGFWPTTQRTNALTGSVIQEYADEFAVHGVKLGGISVSWPFATMVNPDERIHWVIAGGESGPGARPMDVAWAVDLKRQCKAAGVPFFFKQMGAKPHWKGDAIKTLDPKGHDWIGYDGLRVREWPGEIGVNP